MAQVLLASKAMYSDKASVAVEFCRGFSGEVFESTTVCPDATVATFNSILYDKGFVLPAGTKYVQDKTSVGIEETETKVCGGRWDVVMDSVTASKNECLGVCGTTLNLKAVTQAPDQAPMIPDKTHEGTLIDLEEIATPPTPDPLRITSPYGWD